MAGVLLSPFIGHSYDGGAYRCVGTVDELGAVGKYRVRLFRKQYPILVGETWSDANTGQYAFCYLPNTPDDFFVVAHDHGANPVNAAISDQLILERMP